MLRFRWLRRRLALETALVLLLLLTACEQSGPEEQLPAADSEGVYEGLSREEIEQRAEPMTLEEAESLGIVDTTIRIQAPLDPDTVILPDSVALPIGGTPPPANQ